MKSLITAILTAMMLAGCVAVPYYGEPVAAPGYYYYPAPAPSVHFGYRYHRR